MNSYSKLISFLLQFYNSIKYFLSLLNSSEHLSHKSRILISIIFSIVFLNSNISLFFIFFLFLIWLSANSAFHKFYWKLQSYYYSSVIPKTLLIMNYLLKSLNLQPPLIPLLISVLFRFLIAFQQIFRTPLFVYLKIVSLSYQSNYLQLFKFEYIQSPLILWTDLYSSLY